MFTYSFEKLEVWQLSRVLNKDLYLLTKDFPGEEKFGLISQIRRASISVSSNLAEGVSRKSAKDQARFSEIAFGSLMEVMCQLTLSCDLGYLDEANLIQQRIGIERLSNKINSLWNAQINKSK